MFPEGGVKKTAESIMQTLPPLGRMPAATWDRIERADIQWKKFTVTADEVRAPLECRLVELVDSLFYLEKA